jgi:hypothetical protein
VLAALTTFVAACELTNDLSPLKDGQCPSGEKACFVDGNEQCVSTSDPKTGCNAQSCLSCDVRMANAVTTCSATDTCTIAACKAGYINCNQNDADGCEVDSNLDVNNCGLCGTVCAAEANGKPLCINQVCALQCVQGYGDCDLRYSDGCEASLDSDPKNCGHCGDACAPGQTCQNGVCG